MKTAKSRSGHRTHAEDARLADLTAQALVFLAAEPDRLGRFFALTGLGPHDLRGAAADPDFASCLLDYLAADERLFIAFADQMGLDPFALSALRASLSPPDTDA